MTYGSNPSEEALRKHEILTAAIANEGYVLEEKGTDEVGRSFWMMIRKFDIVADDERRRGCVMIPLKKRAGMAAYVSSQPRTAITKRPKTVGEVIVVKRAVGRLPAAKRSKSAEKKAQQQQGH